MASDLAKEVIRLYTELDESQIRSKENSNVMINLMDEFERIRQNWASAVESLEDKDRQIQQLERDLDERDSRIKTLQAELKDARSQVREQLVENGTLKANLEDATKRLKVVQEMIKENGLQLNDARMDLMQQPTVTRSHSVRTATMPVQEMEDDTTSSIDYDRTDDSFEYTAERSTRRSRGFATLARERRSTSLQPRPSRLTSSKRTRLHEENDHLPPKRSKDASKPPPAPQNQSVRRLTTRNRSMSESSLAVENDGYKARQMGTLTPQTASNMDLRSTPRMQMKTSWTHNAPISSRPHTFDRFNPYLKLTTCDVCNESINCISRQAVKCRDCLQIVHNSCKRRLPMPCVPRIVTPMKAGKKEGQSYSLTDFCPQSAPMIPGPIIHLVTALEKKGLETEGIYRVPGAKAQVSRTLGELRSSRAIPNLSMQHVEILGDCIKQFLRELRDPLIPKSSKEEFIRAARKSDKVLLNTAICDLPQPNRDTLAYLILHWQKVMALADVNKMPRENIARCVSMSVMMGQKPVGDFGAAAKETGDCERVLIELLSFPSQYWMRFLTDNAVQPPLVVAPERSETNAANCSMLGPVTTDRGLPPTTPRRLQYFADP